MRYFSMFSGIGGFELGIQRMLTQNENVLRTATTARGKTGQSQQFDNRGAEGLSCIGYSEIDKYAIQIYKRYFPEHKEYGNAANIKWSDVENFDLLMGGFPCQAFSIAGKRGGFSDTRGTLFFEIARVAQEKQPRLLLLENVKGLLSHDKGQTFGVILNALDELGYDLQWQVLNSKNWGVPQSRSRVFIVGHLRKTRRPEIFPIREASGKSCKIFGRVTGLKGHDYLRRVYDKEFASPTLPTKTGGNHIPKINTVRIRRLTPTECERLQGFPDGWTEGLSDSQRYKCLGNAVTVNVVEAIMKKLFL